MFGVIDFLDGTSDYGYSVVSVTHDKSMVAGICAGARIFVCDNLALAGDFAGETHTPGNNFIRLVREAFTLLPGQLENLTKILTGSKPKEFVNKTRRELFGEQQPRVRSLVQKCYRFGRNIKLPPLRSLLNQFNLLMLHGKAQASK
jgi:hypothetical protein